MKQFNLLKNIEDLKDFILGTTILATGGGGSPEMGYELLKELYERVSFIKLHELSSEDFVVSPYFIGSMGSLEERNQRETLNLVRRAFSLLENRISRKISAVVSSEIGGGNTAIALFVAALLDVPVIDGDLMGRAGPELHQSTAHIFNKSVTPSVIVTKTGNSVLIESISSIDDYENIARYVAFLANGSGFVIDTPLSGDDAKQVIIEGTLSLCFELGKEIRKSKESGNNPLIAILNKLNGFKIFEGYVSNVQLKNTGKFLEGNISIKNNETTLDILVKNEYIYASIANKPIVMPPDPIVLLDSNYNPILTNRIKESEFVYVIAWRAPQVWRTPKGLELFGPRHFGINHDYIPVEKLIRV